MVVPGQAGGSGAPHRLGHAEIGVLGEQEVHGSVAAQPGAVDQRVLEQMVLVQRGPAPAPDRFPAARARRPA